jgi:transcriptional regulator with XRE-family HTH domain
MASRSRRAAESNGRVLATRLKHLRLERKWSLAQLSSVSKLSRPYLSRLESGGRQPSLAALISLARIYETPLHSLLEAHPPRQETPIVIHGSQPQIYRGNRLRFRPISGDGAMVNLSAVQVTVPHKRRTKTFARHIGEELLYVLSGTLSLIFEKETHTLETKDSAHFDARLPHRLVAVGNRDAEVLVVAYVANPRAADERLTKIEPASIKRSD